VTNVTDFAIELTNTYNWNQRNGWKIDYYKDASWIRIYFDSDRTILRENVDKIESILKKYKLQGEFGTSWSWKTRYYNGLTFNNDDVTYALFITESNKPYQPVTFSVSDTTDELYDIGLFNLKDAMIKNDIKVEPFDCFERTDFGYRVSFRSKNKALSFYKQNPFERIMDIEESVKYGKKVYYCYIYMNDKTPNPIPVVNIKTITKSNAKKMIKELPSDSKNLIESAMAKLTNEEIKALGLLAFMDLK